MKFLPLARGSYINLSAVETIAHVGDGKAVARTKKGEGYPLQGDYWDLDFRYQSTIISAQPGWRLAHGPSAKELDMGEWLQYAAEIIAWSVGDVGSIPITVAGDWDAMNMMDGVIIAPSGRCTYKADYSYPTIEECYGIIRAADNPNAD